jgi:hypothetical protein
MNRRSFFRLLAGAVVAPALPKETLPIIILKTRSMGITTWYMHPRYKDIKSWEDYDKFVSKELNKMRVR